MPIIVNADVMMAKRKMSLTELAAHVDIRLANLSISKTCKVNAIRFGTTLDAICKVLNCQPGDVLEYAPRVNKTKKATLLINSKSYFGRMCFRSMFVSNKLLFPYEKRSLVARLAPSAVHFFPMRRF